MTKSRPQTVIEKLYVGLLLVIFGGIVLHAPLSVGLGALWPDYAFIFKAWKEVLMTVASLILLGLLYYKKQFKLLRQPVIILIGLYTALHLILLIFLNNGLTASISGLIIDLRYLVFFVLVYMALQLWPGCRDCFIKVGVIGGMIVVIFALLQVFILPHDILKYIGYGVNTIAPYMTVDQNYDFVRINSTLRGPNPLGAYMVILISLVTAFVANKNFKGDKKSLIILSILSIGGLVALWCSYSRSALLAAVLVVMMNLIMSFYHRLKLKKVFIGGILLAVVIAGLGLFMFSGSRFVSNVLLHENPNGDASLNSNDGHINSLQTGFDLMISRPFGAGVGSTGSASLNGQNPLIIENQYIFIAHESGWLGLVLFMAIFGLIMVQLWRRRGDWLALGVFASGLGLAVIGLLLPVWADDTVSIIWWGLAAVAICGFRKTDNLKLKGVGCGRPTIQ